ncbi:MAG: FkbM family methyltransferase, partial [Pseudomonadota bacterium]
DTKAETIELITGDALLLSDEIDAIKIDTSGSEVDVVKGLKQTLKAQRPMVMMDHATQSFERIERLSEEIGYFIAETHPAGRKNRSSSLLIPRPDAAQ